MFARSAHSLVLSLVASSAVGCATQAPDEASLSDASSQLVALVSVEQLEAGGATRTNVSAKFVRVVDTDRDAIDRVIGGRPALPSVGECVPLRELDWAARPGELRSLDGGTDEARTLADLLRKLDGTRGFEGVRGGLELLDVGDVILRVRDASGARGDDAGADLWLAPRAFPDVGEVVSGVFYTSPDASRPIPVPARYAVSGTGSASADPFVLELSAPGALDELTIDGASLSRATQSAEPGLELLQAAQGLVVRAGRDLVLAWSAAAISSDLVYVDIGGAEPHRCTFIDDGHAILPGALLAAHDNDPAGQTSELQLSVHRLRELRGPLATNEPRAANEEPATALVRFDLARTVRLELAAPSVESAAREP
jgi:hypothetical protein